MAAFLHDQLAKIVEQVVNFWVRKIAILDPSGRFVDPSGNMTVGIDQECRDAPDDGGFRDRRQFILISTISGGRLA